MKKLLILGLVATGVINDAFSANKNDLKLVLDRNSAVYAAETRTRDIGWANGQKADLIWADLSASAGINLSASVGANLEKADFSNANLQGADLGNASLSGANFTK